MLLVHVHHIGVAKGTEQVKAERVRVLAADRSRVPENPDRQVTLLPLFGQFAEADKSGGNSNGHESG